MLWVDGKRYEGQYSSFSILFYACNAHWREVFHFDDLTQFDDPAGEKIFHSEAVLGNVQIRSSSAKWSNFGEFKIFFKVFAHLVIRFLGKLSVF